MAQIIVVNRHKVAANRKTGFKTPVLRVSKGRYGSPSYTDRHEFDGKGRVVYDPANPLPCGATCWVEVD